MLFKLLSVHEASRGRLDLIKKLGFLQYLWFCSILWKEVFLNCAFKDDTVFCPWHSGIVTYAWIFCFHVMAEVPIFCSQDGKWFSSLPASPCMQASFHHKGMKQEEPDKWYVPEYCPNVDWDGKTLHVDEHHSGIQMFCTFGVLFLHYS